MVMLRRDGTLPGSEDFVKKIPDELTDPDRWEIDLYHPAYARIQVPLKNKWLLKETAEILEKLATDLRRMHRNPEYSSNRAMTWAWDTIRAVNKELQNLTKSGKSGPI